MLQEFYCDIKEAAEDLAETVAPCADEVTKEEIAEAAADKAEEVADNFAEELDSEITEDQYNEILSTAAQFIYTQAISNLAMAQACYAVEDLFSADEVEDYYASMEDEYQDIYADKKEPGAWDSAKGFMKVNRNELAFGAGAGTVGGGIGGYALARRKAKAKGLRPGTPEYKKFIRKYSIVGAGAGLVAGTAAGAGVGAYKNRKMFGSGKTKINGREFNKVPYKALSAADWFGKYSGHKLGKASRGMVSGKKPDEKWLNGIDDHYKDNKKFREAQSKYDI